MKIAVVTPYYKEPDDKLRRCMESVAAQTYPATHYMVADGFPNPMVGQSGVQHMILPHPHRDVGNTPRGLGGISALNAGHDAIAYLDADNWYAPDHIESMVEALRRTNAHVAFSGRKIVLGDGTLLPMPSDEDASGNHQDTSTFCITSKAAFLISLWCMMDQHMHLLGDQLMFKTIVATQTPFVRTGKDTLFYESFFAAHYLLVGREPPDNPHDFELQQVLAGQSAERSMQRVRMNLTFRLDASDNNPARGAS